MKPLTYVVILPGGYDEPDRVDRVFGSLEALVAYRATQGPRWHWPRTVEVWETDGEQVGDYEFNDADYPESTARPSKVKARVRG